MLLPLAQLAQLAEQLVIWTGSSEHRGSVDVSTTPTGLLAPDVPSRLAC